MDAKTYAGDLLEAAFNNTPSLVPLKSLKFSFLQELISHAEAQAVFPGQVLFEKGMQDKQHLYVLYGQVALQYDHGHNETVSGRDLLYPLAHQQPRPCRAVAKTDVGLFKIASECLDKILSWSQIADYLLTELADNRDYDEDIEWMQTILNSNLFFKVPPVNVGKIFNRITPMVVHAGEVIVRQGEMGSCCYFIKEGEAVVLRHDEALNETLKLADISEGRCFGEDALVNETVRNATVKMVTDGVLMRLEKSDFVLLLKEPDTSEIAQEALLDRSQKVVLIDVRTEEEYAAGHLDQAANIPLNLLSLKKRMLDKEKPYVFYCDTGHRSRAAAHLLNQQGYQIMALAQGLNQSSLRGNLVSDNDYLLRDGGVVPEF